MPDLNIQTFEMLPQPAQGGGPVPDALLFTIPKGCHTIEFHAVGGDITLGFTATGATRTLIKEIAWRWTSRTLGGIECFFLTKTANPNVALEILFEIGLAS